MAWHRYPNIWRAPPAETSPAWSSITLRYLSMQVLGVDRTVEIEGLDTPVPSQIGHIGMNAKNCGGSCAATASGAVRVASAAGHASDGHRTSSKVALEYSSGK